MSQVEHGLGDLVLRPDGNGVANVVLLVVHELTEEAAEVAVLPTVAPVARSEEHTDLSTREVKLWHTIPIPHRIIRSSIA